MAIESHRTALFDTLALPALHESYRNLILSQLYEKFDASPLQSVCWAGVENTVGPNWRSNIIVLPGEERYALENHDIRFSHLQRKAHSCPYHRSESHTKIQEVDGEAITKVSNPHYCTLNVSARPLMCRAFPFGFARLPNESRKFAITAERRALRTVQRRLGSVFVNQMVHNMVQIAMSMWPFLTEAWWKYYEQSYCGIWEFQELAQIDFVLTDDVVMSNIRGASPAWRTEVLAQIAKSDCPACEGKGIEFWDRTLDGKKMLPVPQRRFDICRHCVAPEIGAVFQGLLVDPTSRKVLTADGTEYRGDALLKKDI